MKYGLFYDTETTDLPKWSEPSESDCQPHMVQLAAKLVDLKSFRALSAFSYMIKTSGWVIPPETIEVHGVDNYMANDFGISESEATEMLLVMYEKCDLVVGHNVSFDDRIVRISLKRYCGDATDWPDRWKEKPRFCTANKSTNRLKLPPTEKMKASGRGGKYKKPKLGEAYKFFTGNDLVGAHDALIDVDACIEIYKGLNWED